MGVKFSPSLAPKTSTEVNNNAEVNNNLNKKGKKEL
jgi:hypothetical protein